VKLLDVDETTKFIEYANDAAFEAAEGAAQAGDVYYNTTTNLVRYYNGSSWTNLSGIGAGVNSYIDFDTTLSNPSHLEGRLFYDNTKNALSYYNDESDVALNIGQELYINIRNESGSTITNGSIVYPSGGGSGMILASLADASLIDSCLFVYVATHDIENNTNGYATRFGEVSDVDTSSFNVGDALYLSSTTPGELTNVRADDGHFIIKIGTVKTSDVSGVIFVDTYTAEQTAETTYLNGFTAAQRTATTLSFVNGTRTFTIAPTGSMFYFYNAGTKIEKTSSDSVVITDTEGLHIIYYDGSTLTATATPNDGQIDTIIRTKCPVAYVYWNATDSEYLFIGDERHGISMSPETHSYLHFTRGAQYLSGLGLNSILSDENGSLDTHAQFGIDAGYYTDEDLLTAISAITSTTGLPIYYLSGSSGNLRKDTETGFSVLTDTTAGVGATGRLVYNQYTGGAWQLTTVTNNQFVLYHVIAINGSTGEDQIVSFIGQNVHSTVSAARTAANTEITTLLTQLPFEEIIFIATLIFQTSDSYSNSVKALIRTTDTAADYVDWRTTETQTGSGETSHSSLSNLELADTGITYGHIDDQTQDIYGLKTFNNDNLNLQALNAPTASFTQTSDGFSFLSLNHDTIDTLTPGIIFGSSDSSFTTTNPKRLAGIFGRATQAYTIDSHSGMAMDFFTTAQNQGATPTPSRRFCISDNAIEVNPDYLDQDFYIRKQTSGTMLSYNAGTDTLAVDGTLNLGGTTNITTLNTSGNVNFNPDQNDRDFLIRGTSGINYWFNAGNNNHYYGGNIGWNTTTPDRPLHILENSAGTVTGSASTQLVLENNSTAGINFLSPNTAEQVLYFGDPDDIDVGRLIYSHANNDMEFWTNATEQMSIASDGGVFMNNLKSGATAVAAGAGTNELWVTSGHATLPDNVVMIG
jgi:hypothetical protein